MKILFISNGFPPHQWAGTETYTAGLARELHRRGHAIQVLCGGDWDNGATYWKGYSDESYHGIAVRRLHVNWMKAPDPFRYLYNNPVVAEFFADYLHQIRPNLVHVTSCERLSASVLTVAKDANYPTVLSLTDFWFLCPRINLQHSNGANCDGQTEPCECLKCLARNAKIYRWPRRILSEEGAAQLLAMVGRIPMLSRQRGLRGMVGDMADRKAFLRTAFRLPQYRITASSFVQQVFQANDFDDAVTVQPYGHDISWLKNYHGKTPSEHLRIGYIGQIIKIKGVHLLLEAVGLLPSHVRQRLQIYIYGNLKKSPAYSAKLQALADKLTNVHFCGTYPHEQSGDVFAGIDVLAVPSLWYDFPLIMHEAFAAQTPVIATNLGGMAEAVTHEGNGLLFPRGDAAGLARQLQRLVDDPDLLAQLRSGIAPVKPVSEEVNEFEAIYRSLP